MPGNPNVPTRIRFRLWPASCLPAGLRLDVLNGSVQGRARALQAACDAELRAVDELSGDYVVLQRLSWEVVACHAGSCANGGACRANLTSETAAGDAVCECVGGWQGAQCSVAASSSSFFSGTNMWIIIGVAAGVGLLLLLLTVFLCRRRMLRKTTHVILVYSHIESAVLVHKLREQLGNYRLEMPSGRHVQVS